MNSKFFLERLAELQARREMNDSEVSMLLGVKRQFLSTVKKGDRPMPLEMKFNILNYLGYDWAKQGTLILLPEEIAKKIQSADNERIRQRVKKKATTNRAKEDR